jgi:hypothetical protein
VKVLQTLDPGWRGTTKLTARFGDRLLAVRYRERPSPRKHSRKDAGTHHIQHNLRAGNGTVAFVSYFDKIAQEWREACPLLAGVRRRKLFSAMRAASKRALYPTAPSAACGILVAARLHGS